MRRDDDGRNLAAGCPLCKAAAGKPCKSTRGGHSLAPLVHRERATALKEQPVAAPDICDQCERPVIPFDGRWVHAEAADAAFCNLVMRAPERVAEEVKTMDETILELCSDAGISEDDAERIRAAATLFHDDELKLRAAQMLVDAWQNDHADA